MGSAKGYRNNVNLQDPVGKFVGRRVAPPNPLNTRTHSKRWGESWHRAFPTPFAPRGVFRFRTHEEADQWLMKMITRPAKT